MNQRTSARENGGNIRGFLQSPLIGSILGIAGLIFAIVSIVTPLLPGEVTLRDLLFLIAFAVIGVVLVILAIFGLRQVIRKPSRQYFLRHHKNELLSYILAWLVISTLVYLGLKQSWVSVLLLSLPGSFLIFLLVYYIKKSVNTKLELAGADRDLREAKENLLEMEERFAASLGVIQELLEIEQVGSEAGAKSSEVDERLSAARGRLLEVFDDMFSWTSVPGGSSLFRGGSDTDTEEERDTFSISIYPVTNEQYRLFISATGREPPSYWEEDTYPSGKAEHPVVNISREDATGFCRWLSELTGRSYHLPDEVEWEKAARGNDEREFPWGNVFDTEKCNSAKSGIGDTTPVDDYENGKSPYGCYDMVGNVSEWTETTEGDRAVVRGSSYENEARSSNCYFRKLVNPRDVADSIGFRIVKQGRDTSLG